MQHGKAASTKRCINVCTVADKPVAHFTILLLRGSVKERLSIGANDVDVRTVFECFGSIDQIAVLDGVVESSLRSQKASQFSCLEHGYHVPIADAIAFTTLNPAYLDKSLAKMETVESS